MTTGWGIDPLKDGSGNVTVGTTAADFRQIQGGIYSPGLISGGLVTRSASSLTYTVAAGVAAFPIVTGTNPQTALGPIPAGSVVTTAPTSGSRVDLVYATQRTVTANGDPNIVLGVGTTLPARSVLLNGFTISAGNANTNATVQSANIAYSIPYGASLGLLVNKRSSFLGNFTVRADDITSSFYLPTDRLVRVTLDSTLSALGAVGFGTSATYCEAGYDVFIDGGRYALWSSMGLHQAAAENSWSVYAQLTAGTHTIKTERYRQAGPGTCVARAMVGTLGAQLTVEDIGPVV